MPTITNRDSIFLEFLAGMVLIAVFLGLSSIFVLGRSPRADLEAFAADISTALRQGRLWAMRERAEKHLFVNLDDGGYDLESRRNGQIPYRINIWIRDPARGEIRSGNYRYTFHPWGDIQGGTLFLSDGKRTMAVQPDPEEGSVTLRYR
ncbi:MAG: hypothetical protein PHG91_02605 [Syntrophales bacterium]|nr:hypothetical protein [Syntrophales bacterium]MDD5232263.1 hypothetical protein [Syntrophales bacterium]MDD5531398.1 hypothetical protein [Syntrophales bacterium]